MDSQQVARIINKLKEWFFLIKNDPEAFAESRKLAMGLLVCAVVSYGGSSLFIAPKQKTLAKKTEQKKKIEAGAPAQLAQALAAQIKKLTEEKSRLVEEREILALQVRFGEEQWQSPANQDRFAKTVFTLRADAPPAMEKRLKKMNHQPDRQVNGFILRSVNLGGEAPFSELYDYLRYLERRPEITIIDDLVITRLPGAPEQQTMVAFNLTVGSTSLGKTP